MEGVFSCYHSSERLLNNEEFDLDCTKALEIEQRWVASGEGR